MPLPWWLVARLDPDLAYASASGYLSAPPTDSRAPRRRRRCSGAGTQRCAWDSARARGVVVHPVLRALPLLRLCWCVRRILDARDSDSRRGGAGCEGGSGTRRVVGETRRLREAWAERRRAPARRESGAAPGPTRPWPLLLLRLATRGVASAWREGDCGNVVALGLGGGLRRACTTSEGASVVHVCNTKRKRGRSALSTRTN